jgi:hypothetical protein
MVALYCCITSLPVYPSTIHGHCIVVLLDTSNSSILYCTTLKVQTVYCNWVRDSKSWRCDRGSLLMSALREVFGTGGGCVCVKGLWSLV